MMDIFANQYIILALTFAVFYYVRRIQLQKHWVLLNPILIAIIVLISYLKLTGVSFEEFQAGGKLIEFWLKPAVVALGVPLYLQLEAIKKLWLPIVLSQLVGCLVGIVSVVLIAQWFGASQVVIISMASKSVTTPIAMEVTQAVGGIPSLTAAVVVITGILGAIMGFKTLTVGHIYSPIAQGLSMGTASHAVGASTAMGVSSKYGAFASLGITLNGILTALLTPTVLRFMGII
ncbi:MAG: LrgB family protein [Prevotella sp.]|nr:LrgB family protein [Prevotella sp.]MDD7462506.1 LrgB family protein [Prevotellaceae bacterium]MDY3366177.1 LrgB family protein [Prevotella sp.]MDY3853029.1 LrgB family protein [Prevotella sp.]